MCFLDSYFACHALCVFLKPELMVCEYSSPLPPVSVVPCSLKKMLLRYMWCSVIVWSTVPGVLQEGSKNAPSLLYKILIHCQNSLWKGLRLSCSLLLRDPQEQLVIGVQGTVEGWEIHSKNFFFVGSNPLCISGYSTLQSLAGF